MSRSEHGTGPEKKGRNVLDRPLQDLSYGCAGESRVALEHDGNALAESQAEQVGDDRLARGYRWRPVDQLDALAELPRQVHRCPSGVYVGP